MTISIALTDATHAHLRARGLRVKRVVKLDKEKFEREMAWLRESHRHESEEQLVERAAYILLWHPKKKAIQRRQRMKKHAPLLGWALVAILLLVLLTTRAHAQAGIDTIIFRQSDGTKVGNASGPFTFKAGSGCAFARASAPLTYTFTCSGGSGATFQVNGVNTSDQSTINLQSGSNIGVTNPSVGDVAIAFTGTLAANTTSTTHQFFNAYNSTTGAFSKAQPACGDLSDVGTLCSSSATLAANTTSTAHNFFTAYNSGTGAFTKAQPACGDLSDSGTLCTSSGALAANTTATSHNFLTAYNSTTGAFTKAQPALADLSDGTAAGVVALFSTCSGTQYLGADGACHTATGSVTQWVDSAINGFGAPLVNATVKTFTGQTSGSGDVDVYTVPANKRAIATLFAYNTAGTSTSIFAKLKEGVASYQLAAASTAVASTGLIVVFPLVADSATADVVSFNISQAGLNYWVTVIEFDNTSELKSSVLTSLASGDKTLYTCPGGKTCNIVSFPPSGVPANQPLSVGELYIFNNSGGAVSYKFNVVPSGGSVSASNQFSNAASASSGSLAAKQGPSGLAAGDFISLNATSSTATQIAWVTVIEK